MRGSIIKSINKQKKKRRKGNRVLIIPEAQTSMGLMNWLELLAHQQKKPFDDDVIAITDVVLRVISRLEYLIGFDHNSTKQQPQQQK
jgi:hypothetical protein